MAAIMCRKRCYFEELTVTSPPVTKRIRCSSYAAPVSLSPSSNSFLIEKLIALFPDVLDKQIIEKALEECGNDLDSAIRSLTQLSFESANVQQQGVATNNNAEAQPTDDDPRMDGAEWVELFVSQMKSAADMDDARSRASRALEVLEKSICARAANSYQQENMMLNEKSQSIIQENAILKRAVMIQYERQKEYEDRSQELLNLKQLVSQYQHQLRALEVSKYALTMHLKQAHQSSPMPARFHPDVF